MAPVTVYTTDKCPHCMGAKMLLAKRGIAFEEINLSRDPDGRGELRQRTGMFTFPQILIGDRTLGGFAELRAADQAGQLSSLLAA